MISSSNSDNFINIKYFSQDYDLNASIAESELIEIIYNQSEIDNIIDSDNYGPSISFLLDEMSIESNSYISNNSILSINIIDPTGINISNNIGHNTRYWFDDTDINEIVNNEDFIFSESCGEISFNILLPYNYNNNTLFIESWDNINNMSIDSLKLNIAYSEHEKGLVYNVYNFPNPFSDRTFFTYQIKDFSTTSILTELNIYAQNGRLVKKIKQKTEKMNNFVSIEWDGIDLNEILVPNGTYLYTLNINLHEQTYKTTGVLSIIR
tara:strand:- start:98 stop:895 length:798 start_codon:yes stop_codon:yes gene_type:complete